jgi:hypothetical protein
VIVDGTLVAIRPGDWRQFDGPNRGNMVFDYALRYAKVTVIAMSDVLDLGAAPKRCDLKAWS